jgi:osmoprotectant transport system permease protein
MFDQLPDLLENLPRYLGGHMLLSATALGVGLLVSVPLGILAARRPKLTEMTLGVAGVIQTVPSLALLAVMVTVLRGLIGFWPAFIALTLYSVLPILANTVIGLRGVDPTLIEAARGLGMSERQMLFRVQLPLALPVIIGGIRTATVLVVGTATLVTPVGGESLGNYIFSGLESMNPASTVFGCVVAALLAVVMDQLVRLLEVAARRRSRELALAGGLGLLLVFGGGLASPLARLFDRGDRAVIASGPFTEQHILNEVLARRLRDAGFRPDQRIGMSEGIQIEALRHNQIDCMVNYSGNVWTLVMKRTDVPDDPRAVSGEVARYLKDQFDIDCVGSLGFEDAYAFAMTKDGASRLPSTEHSLEAFAELARDRAARGERLKVGADSQFFTRPEWRWVKRAYRMSESDVERFEMDPSPMYGALKDGQLDAIVAYTSDGRIPAYELELLGDPRRALPPYDALLLLSPAASKRPRFRAALEPLVNAVTLPAMRRANLRVVGDDHWSPRRAAVELEGKLRDAD